MNWDDTVYDVIVSSQNYFKEHNLKSGGVKMAKGKVDLVIGGQYGSEGKGGIALWWAIKNNIRCSVRIGGANAGHTAYYEGKKWVFKQLPVCSILPEACSVVAAGSYLDLEILKKEMDAVGVSPYNLIIDPKAVMIEDGDEKSLDKGNLISEIGSTASGTGWAVMKRIMRGGAGEVRFAKDIPELEPYLQDSVSFMRSVMENGEDILLEGTQGYGLSCIHSDCWPFVTSRDTNAGGFLSEAGLSPFDVRDILMIIRTYPIRVGGNSGPMKDELDWNIVANESGYASKGVDITELTTVTKRIRRVGRFDADMVMRAIDLNQPTKIILGFLDYIDHNCFYDDQITDKATEWVLDCERKIGRKVDYVGWNGKEYHPF